MSLITPSSRSRGGGGKAGARKHENNRIYANPLPLLFVEPPPSRIGSVLGLLGLSLTRVENPHCEGIFDPITRSVWVSNSAHSMILWRRGFFGKGDLSRSEPSWLARQINIRKSGGKQLTSEEITARRRAERKQFKRDRAAAIAAVAEEAEAIFASEGRVIAPALSGPAIPSAATWRPTSQPQPEESPSPAEGETEILEDEAPLVDVEHLQLTLQEAFFLLWNLDCLTVFDPTTMEPMTLQQIWIAFQKAELPLFTSSPSTVVESLEFDNPFLINYAVYHHYRSLGWVVKGGIKFCVDYLLYKRGPVFAHAELALVVMPVYEDIEDQKTSSIDLHNSSPFAWSWLSTINRVNSQVQKTLILVYVTIPAKTRVSQSVLLTPACLAHYSVREVVLRRFIPARMRD
ncbi:putative tRNA-splicing endonuclease subunit tsp-2 [Psilocybe cubensis]|uniref:tRNA-splicing endonuclease subunit tsp-2 n=2 Tax=Psilocybe cubensis TaxID=181762 RepID=A0ACB8GW37_PSICU|nr:putative tRNA-splicing endonuclease subunit tsp-2 [Psilocybe cubensis]KAH9479662.1 putative tRNA-splicing endonuclease subunit tsp-2 [Psilocybe cubensis]